MRNLPRTRNESSALAGMMVATAFAVSCYGLYQVGSSCRMIRAAFLRNPQAMLRALDIEPGWRGEELFRNRLLFSNELFSTFALANSLAGFIVGPLVLALAVSLQNLVRTRRAGIAVDRSRHGGSGDSRSAGLPDPDQEPQCVGGAAGRHDLSGPGTRAGEFRFVCCWLRAWAGSGVVTALVLAGLATGRLDREVLTQSTMSLRYRWEYWQGAWGVITGGATQPDEHSELAATSGGEWGRATLVVPTSSISCRKRARRSTTRTTCFSKFGRRPASGLCLP